MHKIQLKQKIPHILDLITIKVRNYFEFVKQRWIRSACIGTVALLFAIDTYAIFNKISLQYYILAIFFVIYIIILSKKIRKWIDQYNGLVASLSLFVTLGLFFINIDQENMRQTNDRLQIDSKIASIINSDMGRNLKIANDILEDKDNEWIFWWDFSINSYRNNWEYLQRQYNSNCIDEFQTAMSMMEVANNIMYSQRRLTDIMTQDSRILSQIAKTQKERIQYLKNKAVEIKNSLERISEANCS